MSVTMTATATAIVQTPDVDDDHEDGGKQQRQQMQQHRQIEGGGAGQPTVPANQGDERCARHSLMQGGDGASNLASQLLEAASKADATAQAS